MAKTTSDPKPSMRLQSRGHHGWYYAYYDRQSANGQQCVVVFPVAIKDIVRKGFEFDEASVVWDDNLGASVLQLDFDEPAHLGEPSLPPDPESGWGDPDVLPPAPPEPEFTQPEPELVALGNGRSNGHHLPVAPAPQATTNGHRPMRGPALRKVEAQKAVEIGSRLPAAYLKINREVAQAFLLQLALISNAVNEQRRADVAQKLTAISSIPYYRSVGVELSEDDIKGMTAL